MKLPRFLRKATAETATAEPIVYTAADVTKDMTAMMLLYITEMQQFVERKQMSQALVKEKQMLDSLGLSNTKNAQLIANHEKEVNQYNARVDSFLLMTEAWKMFGNDVMIVRYDQFMQLLEKYNLVCGDLSRYKGYIPEKNLQEIARIKGMDVPDKFAVGMGQLERVNLSNDIADLKKAIRFPYEPSGTDALDEMGIKKVGNYEWPQTSIYSNSMYKPFASSLSAMDLEQRFIRIQEELEYRRLMIEAEEKRHKALIPRFFIAAPAQEMEPLNVRTPNTSFPVSLEELKKHDRKKEALKDFANIVETRDPFFCSCTKAGVLIYSKWGDEAQDEIIKRYQTLSQTINN